MLLDIRNYYQQRIITNQILNVKGGERMSIGAIPFVAANPLQSISSGKLNQQSINSNNGNTSKFGNIFSSIVANNTQGADVQPAAEVQELLQADSFEGVLERLGISYDEGLFIVSQGEDEKAVSMDELLENFDDLLSLLNMNVEQLNEILQQITGQEVSINNLSDFIQFINEQPQLSADIAASILGKDNGNQKAAVQLLQIMKLVEMIGEELQLEQLGFSSLVNEQNLQFAAFTTKIDELHLQGNQIDFHFQSADEAMQSDQSASISNLKATLQNVESLISKEGISSSGKFSLEGFEQVVQQAKTKVETSSSTLPNTSMQQNSETRTVTITLPNTNQTSQAESLVKQIEALLQRSQMSNTQGTSKLLIKLHPENLGSIRIELVHRDGAITARLLASTSQAKELLDSQVHQLKQAFVQQNIQLERIDIQQSLQETDLRNQSFFNNMFNGREQQEKEEQHSEEKQEEETKSFKDYLIDEEV